MSSHDACMYEGSLYVLDVFALAGAFDLGWEGLQGGLDPHLQCAVRARVTRGARENSG